MTFSREIISHQRDRQHSARIIDSRREGFSAVSRPIQQIIPSAVTAGEPTANLTCTGGEAPGISEREGNYRYRHVFDCFIQQFAYECIDADFTLQQNFSAARLYFCLKSDPFPHTYYSNRITIKIFSRDLSYVHRHVC